jgi:hypothetical protein
MSFILLTNSNFVISFNLNILEASSLRLSVKEPPKSRSQNPDTYEKNIEILKSQPNVSYKNRQLIDKIAKSYRTKKKKTKSESNAFIYKMYQLNFLLHQQCRHFLKYFQYPA